MRVRLGLAAVLLLALGRPAAADWPYLTEESSLVGEGRYRLSAGISETRQESRHLPGGEGTLWTFPEVEGTLGVGPHAEVSFQYELLWFDPEGGKTGAYDTGDLRLWTKLGLFPDVLRGLALRFGVKLPNASADQGLGTNETDVFLAALYGRRLGELRFDVNAGLAILGDPHRSQTQDDLVTWGVALRGPVWGRLGAGAEASGRSGPFGVDRRRDFATVAAVVGWHGTRWRLDAAGRRGFRDAEGWGWVAGVTYER